jgi:hypothetical protein
MWKEAARTHPNSPLSIRRPYSRITDSAFERYAEGHGRKGEGAGDVSCACHWTVNQAAKIEEGVMWGKAYSVCEAAIVVPPDSSITGPGDLARTDVAVGYHSGSHYSALQTLEVFLTPEDIQLKFVGSSWSRVDAALARKIPAVNVWGPQLYLLEQHGFRRIVSTTFMMAFMFHRDVDAANVERYMRALVRAQTDIDIEPERYKRYFINEIPERFRDKVDVRPLRRRRTGGAAALHTRDVRKDPGLDARA